MKKILLSIFLFFLLPIWYVYGHSLNIEALIYLTQNPNSSWSEFQTHISNQEDQELDVAMEDSYIFLSTILSLPAKSYVLNYSRVNPNFSNEDIKELIQDDPMLWEIWSDVIYNYLVSLSGRYMSWDYIEYYIWLWIDHILAWIDHILFICTLLICLPRKKRILAIITTFTLAHSITILLWGLKIVTVPSIIVESIILLSISLMAVYALYSPIWDNGKKFYYELAVIFILGLFHGLWFAGFFGEVFRAAGNIVVPIIGFNLGVELWQIVVLTVLLTVLTLVYNALPKYKIYIKNTLASIFFVISIYWFVLLILG